MYTYYTLSSRLSKVMLPNSHPLVMQNLHAVIDALRRNAYTEALNYIGEAAATAQNEADYCYRTDPVLTQMLGFLLTVGDAIATLQRLDPTLSAEPTRAMIVEIRKVLSEQEKMEQGLDTQRAPNGLPDYFELEHRRQLYGKKDNG